MFQTAVLLLRVLDQTDFFKSNHQQTPAGQLLHHQFVDVLIFVIFSIKINELQQALF